MDPFERVEIGNTGVHVTRLGMGGVPLSRPPTADALMPGPSYDGALATVKSAYQIGVRYFDTAPVYGSGISEVRVGRGLEGKPRDDFVLSTKVGRVLDLADPHDSAPKGPDGVPAFNVRFDLSREGIMRSLEESLRRLNLDRVDILYLHDPDAESGLEDQAYATAFPTLLALREQGLVRAIGTGMNQWEMPARFIRRFDIDVVLLAGRYTLLDQSAHGEFLNLCLERGVRIAIGGPYNSGILAAPDLSKRVSFNYAPAPPEWVDKAARLRAVCDRHGVALKAAALQFVLAHPAVATVIPGAASSEEAEENARLIAQDLPVALWAELKREGLLPADAPTP